MIVLIVLAFAVVFIKEFSGLKKLRSPRDTVFFCALTLCGFVLMILISNNITLPSPIKGIWYLIDEVLKISYPIS